MSQEVPLGERGGIISPPAPFPQSEHLYLCVYIYKVNTAAFPTSLFHPKSHECANTTWSLFPSFSYCKWTVFLLNTTVCAYNTFAFVLEVLSNTFWEWRGTAFVSVLQLEREMWRSQFACRCCVSNNVKKKKKKSNKKKSNQNGEKKGWCRGPREEASEKDQRANGPLHSCQSNRAGKHIPANQREEHTSANPRLHNNEAKANQPEENITANQREEHIQANQREEHIPANQREEHIPANQRKEQVLGQWAAVHQRGQVWQRDPTKNKLASNSLPDMRIRVDWLTIYQLFFVDTKKAHTQTIKPFWNSWPGSFSVKINIFLLPPPVSNSFFLFFLRPAPREVGSLHKLNKNTVRLLYFRTNRDPSTCPKTDCPSLRLSYLHQFNISYCTQTDQRKLLIILHTPNCNIALLSLKENISPPPPQLEKNQIKKSIKATTIGREKKATSLGYERKFRSKIQTQTS